MSKELAESLKKCKVQGDTLFLPPITDGALPNYNEVKTALLKAGAKYNKNSFVFPDDAQQYIDKLTGGESINIQKQFQFFETNSNLGDDLVFEAHIESNHSVLEPSAGRGAIINAIHRRYCNVTVDYCELMDLNRNHLSKLSNVNFLCDDFLELKSKPTYDRIIANPPFKSNQDILHILKMYEMLKKGGRLVSIASKHWQHSTNKKETEFRNWLKEVGAVVREIEAGEFKESGTNVATVMIIINKK